MKQWRLLGTQNWLYSGQIAKIVPGHYIIEYKDVVNCEKPENMSVTVTDDKIVYANYTCSDAGHLQVVLFPRTETLRWRLLGTSTWNDSDHILYNLPIGIYHIEYESVPGYITPPVSQIMIDDGSFEVVQETYPSLNIIKVTILYTYQENWHEEHLSPGNARWSIDGGEEWIESGEEIRVMFDRNYTITLEDISTWMKPNNINIYIDRHDELTDIHCYYTYQSFQYGNEWNVGLDLFLPVNVIKEFENSMTFIDVQQLSREHDFDLSLPVHLIQKFESAPQEYSFEGNKVLIDDDLYLPIQRIKDFDINYEYDLPISKLQINISYVADDLIGDITKPIDGNAKWSIDNINWFDSGTIIDVTPGIPYTIRFENIYNTTPWLNPSNQIVTVNPFENRVVDVDYYINIVGIEIFNYLYDNPEWSTNEIVYDNINQYNENTVFNYDNVKFVMTDQKQYTFTFKEIENYIVYNKSHTFSRNERIIIQSDYFPYIDILLPIQRIKDFDIISNTNVEGNQEIIND